MSVDVGDGTFATPAEVSNFDLLKKAIIAIPARRNFFGCFSWNDFVKLKRLCVRMFRVFLHEVGLHHSDCHTPFTLRLGYFATCLMRTFDRKHSCTRCRAALQADTCSPHSAASSTGVRNSDCSCLHCMVSRLPRPPLASTSFQQIISLPSPTNAKHQALTRVQLHTPFSATTHSPVKTMPPATPARMHKTRAQVKKLNQDNISTNAATDSGKTSRITTLLSQWQLLRSLCEHLSSADIIHLGETSKEHWQYIGSSLKLLKQLIRSSSCDGRGIVAQARVFGHWKGKLENATRKCRGKNAQPCVDCGAMVCNVSFCGSRRLIAVTDWFA